MGNEQCCHTTLDLVEGADPIRPAGNHPLTDCVHPLLASTVAPVIDHVDPGSRGRLREARVIDVVLLRGPNEKLGLASEPILMSGTRNLVISEIVNEPGCALFDYNNSAAVEERVPVGATLQSVNAKCVPVDGVRGVRKELKDAEKVFLRVKIPPLLKIPRSNGLGLEFHGNNEISHIVHGGTTDRYNSRCVDSRCRVRVGDLLEPVSDENVAYVWKHS